MLTLFALFATPLLAQDPTMTGCRIEFLGGQQITPAWVVIAWYEQDGYHYERQLDIVSADNKFKSLEKAASSCGKWMRTFDKDIKTHKFKAVPKPSERGSGQDNLAGD